MIIQCEACKRKFRVDGSKINPPGVKVRCSKCGDVFFFEYKPGDEVEAAKPEEFGGENPLSEDVAENELAQNIDTQTEQQMFSAPDTTIEDDSPSLYESDSSSNSEDIEIEKEVAEASEFIDKELFEKQSEEIESNEEYSDISDKAIDDDQGDYSSKDVEVGDNLTTELIEKELDDENHENEKIEEHLENENLFETGELEQSLSIDEDDSVEDEITEELDSLENGLLDSQNENSEVEEIPNKEEILEVSLSEIDNIDVSKETTNEDNIEKELDEDLGSVEEISVTEQNQQDEDEKLNPLENLEIDTLDDLVQDQKSFETSDEKFTEETPEESVEQKVQGSLGDGGDKDDTNNSSFTPPPDLSIDQDAIEETFANASPPSPSSMQNESTKTVSRRSYSTKTKKSFFSKLLTWIISILIIGTLFFTSMYVLNETKIYENNFFSIIQGFTGTGFLSETSRNKYKRNILIKDDGGAWYSSKQGQVYVVSGQIVNRSENSVNFVKLKSEFLSTGEKLFEQEFYSGNTLSNWEIKNSSFDAINKKLNRKTGDINYEDVDNLAGLNFDIQPGESIPFYTVFPAKNKILGLKHKIKVVDLETSTLEEKGE